MHHTHTDRVLLADAFACESASQWVLHECSMGAPRGARATQRRVLRPRVLYMLHYGRSIHNQRARQSPQAGRCTRGAVRKEVNR